MVIQRINGQPYTTAAQDMHLIELKREIHRKVSDAINHALQTRRPGEPLKVDLRQACEIVEQAYYKGRDDAG